MDPFDRFLRRSLDEALVSQGLLSREKADELMAIAKDASEPISVGLVEAGVLTAWDLAKTVSSTYQMPVHPLTGYRFDKDLFEGLPAGVLHRHLTVPLGVFGRTRTFAVVEPPTRDLLDELQAVCGPSLFFFVSELPEVRQALRDHVKVVDSAADKGWQKLFDSAEEEVERDLSPRKPR